MKFIGGFICALLLLAVACAIYVYAGAFPIAASSPDNAFEQWLFSTTMKRAVVAMAGKVGAQPQFSDEMVKDGFGHFDEMCIGCHGGPGIERNEIGKGLNPQAPTLSDVVKEWTPQQLFWIIKHGVKMTAMPSFGATHSDEEVWSIVAFIERLARISPEQYQQMRHELSAGHREQHGALVASASAG